MNDYTKLDQAILAALAGGPKVFSKLHTGDVLMITKGHERAGALNYSRDFVESWRYLDRRLQALRKKGQIEYSSKTGWSLCPTTPNPQL